MTNPLAILALTLKDNAATPTEITSSITGLTVSDGANTYSVTRAAAAGPIYVVINPTSSATIGINATDLTVAQKRLGLAAAYMPRAATLLSPAA